MAELLKTQNNIMSLRNIEIAGKGGADMRLWQLERIVLPILIYSRFWLYIIYFVVAFSAIAFCAFKGGWNWRIVSLVICMTIAFPYILPMIQWVLYKVGVFLYMLIMGTSVPEIRNRYKFGVNSIP